MLTEILDTRVMIKQGMKLAKDNKVSDSLVTTPELHTDPVLILSQALMRMLEARQLSLKFIASVQFPHFDLPDPFSNVTYGYTSATFSGRMPAVEVADSIVQSGRETLEKVGGSIPEPVMET